MDTIDLEDMKNKTHVHKYIAVGHPANALD